MLTIRMDGACRRRGTVLLVLGGGPGIKRLRGGSCDTSVQLSDGTSAPQFISKDWQLVWEEDFMKRATSSVFGGRSLCAVLFLVVAIQFATGQANVQGKWTTLSYTTPINPVHAALLSNGKILIVAGSGSCPPYLSVLSIGPAVWSGE